LKKIVKLSVGNNHFLALSSTGAVYAWGGGDQNQLGRRIVERTRLNSLVPREFGLPRKGIVDIFACPEHSFALHKNGTVYSWGANNYGQCGHFDGVDNQAVTPTPQVVNALKGKNIKMLTGGSGHSLALTEEGDVLVWGRGSAAALGLDLESVSDEDVILDEHGRRAILKVPTALPGIKASWVAASNDHNVNVDNPRSGITKLPPFFLTRMLMAKR